MLRHAGLDFPAIFSTPFFFFFLLCFVDLGGGGHRVHELSSHEAGRVGVAEVIACGISMWCLHVQIKPKRLVNRSASLGGLGPLIHDLHLLWPYHFWLDKVATHTHWVQMSRVPWPYIIQEQQQQLKCLELVGSAVADLRLWGSGWRNVATSWKFRTMAYNSAYLVWEKKSTAQKKMTCCINTEVVHSEENDPTPSCFYQMTVKLLQQLPTFSTFLVKCYQ